MSVVQILKGLAPIQSLSPCAGEETGKTNCSQILFEGSLCQLLLLLFDAQVITKLWSLFTFPVDAASDPVWASSEMALPNTTANSLCSQRDGVTNCCQIYYRLEAIFID